MVVDERYMLRIPTALDPARAAPLMCAGITTYSPLRQFGCKAGDNIGGIPETQEMLDYCGEHEIVADVEVIPIQKVNDAYASMQRGDVRYRFVIDCASLGA